MTQEPPVVFFDGVCNLCNASVQWIIRKDKKRKFRFAPLQGKTAVELMATGNDSNPPKSVILYSNGKIYDKSGAALRIAVQLGFPYTLLGLFFLVPPFIRNFIYDYIARNRYRWFGKKDACMIPTPELKSLFLD